MSNEIVEKAVRKSELAEELRRIRRIAKDRSEPAYFRLETIAEYAGYALEDAVVDVEAAASKDRLIGELVKALEYAREHVAKYAWTQGDHKPFHDKLLEPIDGAIDAGRAAIGLPPA